MSRSKACIQVKKLLQEILKLDQAAFFSKFDGKKLTNNLESNQKTKVKMPSSIAVRNSTCTRVRRLFIIKTQSYH